MFTRIPAVSVAVITLLLSLPPAALLAGVSQDTPRVEPDRLAPASDRLDRICVFLEKDNPNQRAAARRQLREEIGLEDLEELRAYLERRLPRESLEELADRFHELVGEKLREVETHILAFEAARRLAREQAEEDRRESTDDTRERLAQTRTSRNQAYDAAHAGLGFLARQGVALGPALWQHIERGGSTSPGMLRFHASLWERVVSEARRIFPSAPDTGTISPFLERSLAPLTADLAGDDPEGWDVFRDRLAAQALALLETYSPTDRRQARSVFLQLGSWGVERLERWAAEEQGEPPSYLRRRIAGWNRLSVPVGFVDRTGLDVSDYPERNVEDRLEILYRLQWVGGDDAIPILARLLQQEEDLSLKVECAAALARLRDPRGGEFLRRLGLAGAMALEGVSRDVLLIEALHRRETGDREGALTDLVDLLRRTAADFRIHYEIAYTALLLRRLDLCIEHFRKANEFDDSNENAHYNLACAYALADRLDEALAALERCIAAGFDDPDHMSTDPDLLRLRNDPRFEKLLSTLRDR